MAQPKSQSKEKKHYSLRTVGEFERVYKIHLNAPSNTKLTTYLKSSGKETLAKVLEKAEKSVVETSSKK
jgi:hypothetical protein